jgi:hypothetical protein
VCVYYTLLTHQSHKQTHNTNRREVATDIVCLQEYFLEDSYRGLFEAELGQEYEFIVSVA